MEKFKKKVILGSIGFGIATGAVIGTALTFHYLKKALIQLFISTIFSLDNWA